MYLIKNLIKKIFFYLFQKYKIIFNKPGLEFVDTSQLVTFNESYKNFRIYKEGLKRSNNEHTENFLKQNRFLNVIHTAKYILSQNEVFDFAECGCWRGHSSFLIAKSIFPETECRPNADFRENISSDTRRWRRSAGRSTGEVLYFVF